jgi:RHS repeat-associated protein
VERSTQKLYLGNHVIQSIRLVRFVAVFFAAAFLSVAHAQPQFANASFETPVLSVSEQALPSGAAWTFAGTAGIRRGGTAFNTTRAGDQIAYLSNTGTAASAGSISQTVYIGRPGAYQLRFMAASTVAGSGLRITFGGAQIDSDFVPRSDNLNLETWWTQPFTVSTPGNYEVKFAQTSVTSGARIYLDQILLAAPTLSFTNGSFENVTGAGTVASPYVANGWSLPYATIVTPGYAGNYALRLNSGIAETTLNVPSAASYSISFRGSGSNCAITFYRVDAGVGYALTSTTLQPGYQSETTAAFSLPAGANVIRIQSNCDTIIDNLSLNRAAPIVNVGFETPDIGTPLTFDDYLKALNPAGATWIFSGNSGIEGAAGSGVRADTTTTRWGKQVAFSLTAGSAISQAVSLDTGTWVVSARVRGSGLRVALGGVTSNLNLNSWQVRPNLNEVLSEPFYVATAGSYNLSFIDAVGGQPSFEEPRLIKLNDSAAPSTSIALRIGGNPVPAVVTPGGTLEITATASDPDGLQRIRILRNGVALAPESTATFPASATSPLAVSVSPLTAGSYTFTAEATDHTGAVGAASQNLLVNTPPTVAITSPANNSGVTSGTFPVFISGTATESDAGQTISALQLYRRVAGVDRFLGVYNPPPGSASVSTDFFPSYVAGSQQYFLRAIDSVGGQNDSLPITMNVSGLLNGSFEYPGLSGTVGCQSQACEDTLVAMWQFRTKGGSVSATTAAGIVVNGAAGFCGVSTTVGTQAAYLRGASADADRSRIKQTVYLTPGVYDVSLRGVRTSSAHGLVVTVAGTSVPAIPLTTAYASYATTGGLPGGFVISTAGTYDLTVDSNATDSLAYACIDDVKLTLRNAVPTFSAFTVTPSGVQQAPVTNVSLSATAADPDTTGYVATIEYLINGASASPALICTNNATTPAKPFTCNQTWTGAVAGTSYSITARAIDNTGGAGGTTVSAATSLVFNRAPTASFTYPAANAQLGGPNAIVPLTVTTSDPDGDAITKVEFYNGATLLGTVNTGQAATANQPAQSGNVYVLNSAALAAGSYTITAKVYDNRGGATATPLPSVAFTVKATNAAPTVTLATVPSGIITAAFGTAVNFTASATDSDSGISSIAIVDTTTSTTLGTCNYSPAQTNPPACTASLPGTAAVGNHVIVARATDSVGSTVTPSTSITIAVTASVANGSFETPSQAGVANLFTYLPTGASWTFTGNAAIQRNGSAWAAPAAPDGVQTAVLQCGVGATAGRIAQDIAFSTAATIQIKLFWATRQFNGQTNAQPVQLKVGGVNQALIGGTANTAFTQFTSNAITVAAGTQTIELFATQCDTDRTTYIDKVELLLLNSPPTFSAFTVTPSGVQQAPVTNVSLSATAADPDTTGYVATIEYLINGASASPALICTNNATTPAKPFTCNQTWTGAVAGTSYSITARAIDNTGGAGGTTVSAATSLVFNRAPTASFTYPAANAQLGGPNAIVPLTVTTSDPDGDAITKVEFYNGATLLGTVNTGQAATANQPAQSGNVYVLNSAALAAGSYTITAKVYDNRGGATATPLPSVAFTVKATNAAPTVTLATVPSGIITAAFGTAVNFTASATDSDSGISSIAIVDTTTSTTLGTCNYSPAQTNPPACTASLPGTAAVGNHVIVARATDSVGSTVTPSTTITINVTAVAMTCTLLLAPNSPIVGSAATLTSSCTNGGTPIGGVTYAWSAGATCGTSTVAANVNSGTCSVTPASTTQVTYTVTPTKTGYTVSPPSQSITVTPIVNPGPKIVFISPSGNLIAGSVVTASARLTDDASVSNANASVSANGVSVASNISCPGLPTTSANCSVTWTPSAAGVYSVAVTAIDNNGASSTATTTVAVGEVPGTGVQPLNVPTTTVAIGAIPGQFAVSESGAATYAIPIEVALGVNGIQPNLAIAYNSQGGDGHLGVGFGLSGTSYITRCPKTIATDGVREPINYDNVTDAHSGNDAFCLDGQRLIPYTASDRVKNAACRFPQFDSLGQPTGVLIDGTCPAWEFRTELESYSRIIAIAESDFNYAPGSGPTRFRVYAKSGQVLDYGSRWWGVARKRPDNTVSLLTNPTFEEDFNLQYSCWVDGSEPCLSVVRAQSGNALLTSAQIAQGAPRGYFKTYNTGASTAGAGWTFGVEGSLANAGVQQNGSAFSTSGPNTSYGVQTAFLQRRGYAANTGFLEAGLYTLSFRLAGRLAGGPPEALYGGNQSIVVRVKDAASGNVSSVSGPYATVSGQSFTDTSVVINIPYTGNHAIMFVGTVDTDDTALIDDVRLVPVNNDINVIKIFPLDRVEDRSGNYMHVDYGGTTGGETVVSSFGRSVVALTSTAEAAARAPTAQGARPALEMYPRRFTYGMRTSTPGNGAGAASVGGVEISRVILNYADRADVTTLFDVGSATTRLSKVLQSVVVAVGGTDDTSLRTQRMDFFCRERGELRDARFQESANTVPIDKSGCVPIGGGLSGVDPSYQCTDGSQSGCGTVLRRYNLAYSGGQATGRSRLDAVQMCSIDPGVGNVCLPGTTFTWSDEGTLANPISTLNATGSSQNAKDTPIGWDYLGVESRIADVVGDGRSRIVKLINSNTVAVCTHSGSAFTCQNRTTPAGFNVPASGSTKTWHLADINGDGVADLVVTSDTSAFACLSTKSVATLANMDQFSGCANLPANLWPENTTVYLSQPPTSYPNSLYPAKVRVQRRLYAKPGDFDADGKMDIAFYRGDGRFEICRNMGNGDTVNWSCANPGYIGVQNFSYASRDAEQELKNSVFTDFNGDGRTDLAMRAPDACVNGTNIPHSYTDPVTGLTETIPNGTPTGKQCQLFAEVTSKYWSVCFATGSLDVAPGSPGAFQFNCSSRSGAGIGGAVSAVSGEIVKVSTYDFNGDGLADLAVKVPGQNAWRVCLSTGDGEFYRGADANGNAITTGDCPIWSGNGNGPSGEVDKTIAGDFNGDGRTDLARWVSGRTWEVCLSTGTDFRCSQVTDGPRRPADRCTGGCYEALVGDFNGDGKSDIVVNVHSSASGNASGTLSGVEGILDYNFTTSTMPDLMQSAKTGLLAETRVRYVPLTSNVVQADDGVVYKKYPDKRADPHFPNPGVDEIIIQSPMYVVESSWGSTGGNSSDWFKSEYRYIQLVANKWGRGMYGFRGRTIAENILTDASNTAASNNRVNQVVTGMTSSHKWPHIGRTEDITKSAKRSDGSYQLVSSTSNLYFARCRDGGSVVVACPASTNASGYRWESFQVLAIQNPRYYDTTAYPRGIVTELESNPNDPSGAGKLPTTIVYTGVDPALYTGDNAVTAANITSQFPPSIASYYDNFGNPLKVTTRTLHPDSARGEKWEQTVTNTYYNSGGDTSTWLLGKLQSATTTSTVSGTPLSGSSSATRKSSFTYQGIASATCTGAVAGQLCSETVEPDAETATIASSDPIEILKVRSLFQRTSYQYDAFGNRTNSAVSYFDLNSAGTAVVARTRESMMDYSVGKYPTTTTRVYRDSNGALNATLNLSDTREYADARCRMPTKVKDANNNYATMSYDGFCRKVAEAAYTSDNKLVKWTTFALDQTGLAGGESYRLVTTGSDGGQSMAFYDNLQRAVRSQAKTFSNGFTEAKTTFDALGRQMSVTKRVATTTTANPTTVSSDEKTTNYLYDSLNRVTLETLPDTGTVTTTYAGLSTTVKRSNNAAGAGERSSTKTANAKGMVETVTTSPTSTIVTSKYDALGNLTQVTSPAAGGTMNKTMAYDIRGRQTSLVDPDAGTYSYLYNGLGEQVRQTDPRNLVTSTVYDGFGRKVSRSETDSVFGAIPTIWQYDCANARGLLCSVSYGGSDNSGASATAKTTVYDVYSRPSQTVTTIAGQRFTSSVAYDGLGRPKYSVYPQATAYAKPVSLETIYDVNTGYATEVKHAETGLSYWKVDVRADDGQLVRGTLGGVISVNQTYSSDGLGRLARINISSGVGVAMPAVGTTGLLNQTFGFDSVGNLLNRTLNAPAGAGAARAESETFTYDFLDRFVGHNGSGVTDIGVAGASTNAYDLAGNITSKAGMQMGYTTGSNRLCAITSTTCGGGTGVISYDASGNITRYTRPTAAQAPTIPGADGATLDLLQYTTFNLPLSITKTVAGSITASGQYFYDAGYQRVRQIKRNGPVGTGAFADDILYVVPGGFEVSRDDQGRVKSSVATISGPDGTVATVATNYDVLTGLPIVGAGLTAQTASISGTNTVTKLLLKDHLGSMVAEVTLTGSMNPQGQVTAVSIVASSLNVHGFGPWGNARNGLNGDSRGFTGHEHLAELGLIHMNGRIYDPVLGRFLQADPIIQAPHNAQSHNRYSYVMNNPLSFTDPSGFSSWTKFRDRILKPVIGLAVGWFLGPMVGNWLGQLFFSMANSCTAAAASLANFLGAVSGGFAAGGIAGGNTQSALQGAFSAGLFFGAGSLADVANGAGMSGFGDGGLGRAALHAAVGCASGAAAGGSCGRGAASAGFAEFAGTRVGAAFGGGDFAQIASKAIVGGIASRIGGGRFENGALTAAFGHLFNCNMHGCGSTPEERGAPEGQATEIAPTWENAGDFLLKGSAVAGASIGLPMLGVQIFAASGSSLSLAFSQTTASAAFSAEGVFAGQTIGQVASALRAGSLLPKDVVVQYVTMNGNALIVNTRSALALIRAGVPQAEWSLVANQSMTGHIVARLGANGLTSAGTSTIRITGLGRTASSLR